MPDLKIKFRIDKHSHYKYFARICNKHKLKYYKYKASIFWEGPAIILENNRANIKLRYKFKIPINQDIINQDIIAIYPKKNENVNSLKYDYIYEMESVIVETVIWEYNNHRFLLNEDTDNVYDFDTKTFLGRRTILDDNKYNIDCDADEY